MLHALQTMEQPDTPDLLSGIHQKLERAPWWKALADRFVSPWPDSLPLHGAAVATAALLVLVVVNLRAPEARIRLAQKAPLDAIAIEGVGDRIATDRLAKVNKEADEYRASHREEEGLLQIASVPLALSQAVAQGRVQPGDLVLLTSFGAGFHWAAALVQY